MQEHRVTFSWTVAALAEGEEELESQYRVQLTILLDRPDFYDVAPSLQTLGFLIHTATESS